MNVEPAAPIPPDQATADFYVDVLRTLDRNAVRHAVGGGYAMAYYTGIARNTKDLDLFVKPEDRDRCLSALSAAGYRTEFFYEFWIAKVLMGPEEDAPFVDILYNSGNGLCPVDDAWFDHAIEADVLGYRTRLVPAEEQLWSKAFVQDRDRFDGADVNHLILARGQQMDWSRLLRRFSGHERVLMAHLMLFGYAYPTERHVVPDWVMKQLESAVRNEPPPDARLCRGPMLAHSGSYKVALQDWSFEDARVHPHGPLTPDQVAQLPHP